LLLGSLKTDKLGCFKDSRNWFF